MHKKIIIMYTPGTHVCVSKQKYLKQEMRNLGIIYIYYPFTDDVHPPVHVLIMCVCIYIHMVHP